MARLAALAGGFAGAEQRHGGQPVYQPAGQQHQQQLEQRQHRDDLQRQRARQHARSATTQRHCTGLHGRRPGLMPDRCFWVGVVQRDRDRWGHIPARPALRTAEAGQDDERVWAEGGGGRHLVPGHASVSRYGHGGDAVPISRGDWQAGHADVAAKPRVETRLCDSTA